MIYDEWNNLGEVIVGTSYEDCTLAGLEQIVDETNEDLDTLAKILEDEWCTVHRPKQPEFAQTKEGGVEIHHPIMPRDSFGFFGDKMIQTQNLKESKQAELGLYEPIVNSHMLSRRYGLWRMPHPSVDPDHGVDVLWRSSNLMKCGYDILYTQPVERDETNGIGTQAGLDWIATRLGTYNFIEVPTGGHVNSKLTLLKPGLLMTHNEKFIPKELRKWDKIIVEQIKKPRFSDTYTQTYLKNFKNWKDWTGKRDSILEINCLVIRPDKIITTAQSKDNIKKMEDKGIEVVIWDHRHRYFWDGGVHDCTQDTARGGERKKWR